MNVELPHRAHERCRIRIEHIGREHSPVVIVDDFLSHPEQLVDVAAHRSFSKNSQYYPGVRSPAPASYRAALITVLRSSIAAAFRCRETIEVTESDFSVVTTPATELVPFQRIPHIDGTDPGTLAVLHYLCEPEHGGTSFYRHRATQLERLSNENIARYVQAVESEVQRHGMPPPRFIDGDTPLFERIARYDAAFNRVLIYSGTILHSGNIPVDFVPDPNPRTGRLTINSFVKVRA